MMKSSETSKGDEEGFWGMPTSVNDYADNFTECISPMLDVNRRTGEIITKYENCDITGVFNSSMRSKVIKFLARAKRNGQMTVVFNIDSPGGEVDALLQMLNMCKDYRENGGTIYTVVRGNAASCAQVFTRLAASPGCAFAFQYAAILLHEMAAGTRGKVTNMQAQMKSLSRLNKGIFQDCAIAAGYGDKYQDVYVELASRQNDQYISPIVAWEIGLVDDIIQRFNTVVHTCVKIDVSFSSMDLQEKEKMLERAKKNRSNGGDDGIEAIPRPEPIVRKIGSKPPTTEFASVQITHSFSI